MLYWHWIGKRVVEYPILTNTKKKQKQNKTKKQQNKTKKQQKNKKNPHKKVQKNKKLKKNQKKNQITLWFSVTVY